MTLEETKKYLYKEKPTAFFQYIANGNAFYTCAGQETFIAFSIPVSDMGEAKFSHHMEAKHLIRWIIN